MNRRSLSKWSDTGTLDRERRAGFHRTHRAPRLKRCASLRRRIGLWHIHAMREPQPKAIHLKDYTPPAFRIESIDLDVDLRDDHARVRAKLQVRRNAGSGPLVLDGEELELISVSLDG